MYVRLLGPRQPLSRASQQQVINVTVFLSSLNPSTGKDVLAGFEDVVCASQKLPPVTNSVKLAAAKAGFAELEEQGIIARSSSPWVSPFYTVQKPDELWRPCDDYCHLNLVTQPNLYPPPQIEDLYSQLEGKTIFSKLALRKGYHQVPLANTDIKKMAVITPFGLFVYRSMAFGLWNAGQTFQRMMDQVLIPRVFIYLDDILVASSSKEEHWHDLCVILGRLQQHSLS